MKPAMKRRFIQSLTCANVPAFSKDELRLPNMKLPHRRQFLHLGAGAILSAGLRQAAAQTYPNRPIRLIVPYPPAGNADLVARLMGQSLSERLGAAFVIDNRPGAATNLGTEAAVRAPADGYTLLIVTPPSAINATLYAKLNFNFIRDIAPIAAVLRAPFVMEVTSSFPAKTVAEFIAYAKAHPDGISMASSGIGSGPHVAGELFKMISGAKMVHVPYRGTGPALTDLIGGRVQVYFDGLPTSIEQIKAGKLRPLAVTTAARSEVLPEVPTVGDFLPGYEASYFAGFGAPKGTPDAIIDKLNREINAVLAEPRVRARIAELGGTALTGSPADFGKLIADETEKWAKVVKFAGIKAE
jgi:tripartite-type tricarboxylate transporter receptor subunit TctC